MKVKDVMATDFKSLSANDTVDDAATLMASDDVSTVPVVEDGKLTGLLTDRDITSRLVAQQRDAAATPVSAVMSDQLHYCHGDDDIQDIVRKLASLHLVQMPVVDEHKKLLGMVSIRDLSARAGESGSNRGKTDGNDLDEALDETFPASDPVSPP